MRIHFGFTKSWQWSLHLAGGASAYPATPLDTPMTTDIQAWIQGGGHGSNAPPPNLKKKRSGKKLYVYILYNILKQYLKLFL
jgi:hypothetical protein